jgi:hypothetical protein
LQFQLVNDVSGDVQFLELLVDAVQVTRIQRELHAVVVVHVVDAIVGGALALVLLLGSV